MIKFFIRTLFCYLFIYGHTIALAQNAAILPQGKTQFLDNNGNPLSSGKVDFYIPSTTTRKTTWQDAAKTIANANPVVLDAGGRAIIYGDGTYRQVVKNSALTTIYDAVTASAGSGGGTTGTGDGDLVGTVKAWAGLVAPNQYVFAYGQEISRTTYAAFFTAVTLIQNINCTSGSPVLTGLSDTSQIPIGASLGSVLEATCIAAGSTVISKTSTTVTMNNNASLTTSTSGTFFLYGNGNGSTTFNVPDLRGWVVAGRTNMGGTASTNLTTAFFLNNPAATGAKGGSQTQTLLTSYLPPYTPSGTISAISATGTINTPTISITGGTIAGTGSQNLTAGASPAPLGANAIVATSSALTFTPTGGTATFAGNAQGGTSASMSIVPPTQTLNYIIKITPDQNSADASGVTSLGLMTGDIACGAGLNCTGNIISSNLSGSIIDAKSCGFIGNGSDETATFASCIATYSSPTDIGSANTIQFGKGNFCATNIVFNGIIRFLGAGEHQTKFCALNGGSSNYFISDITYTTNQVFPNPPIYIENVSIDCKGFKDNCYVMHSYESLLNRVFLWGTTINTGTNLLITSLGIDGVTATTSGIGDNKIIRSYIGYSTATAGYQVRINDAANKISDVMFIDNLMQQAVIKDFYNQAGGLAGYTISRNHSFLALGSYDWDLNGMGQSFIFQENYVEGNMKATSNGPATANNWLSNNTINGRLDVAFAGGGSTTFVSTNNNFATTGTINSLGTTSSHNIISQSDKFGTALAYTWNGGAANPSIITALNSTNASTGKVLNGVSGGSVNNAAFTDGLYINNLRVVGTNAGIVSLYDNSGANSFISADTSGASLDGDTILFRNRVKSLTMFSLTATASNFNAATPPVLFGLTSGSTKLQASAVAGSTILTLPAATDTLVGKATTDTLTNKTLTSPIMTTPTLGVASATSINKVTITAPATGSTLTIVDGKTATFANTLGFAGVDGKTLNFQNSITLAGTDAQTYTFPAATTSIGGLNTNQTWTGNNTFTTGTHIIGAATTNTGIIQFKGTTSGTVSLSVIDAAGTWTMKLPTTAGSSTQFLQTDGAGNTTWASPAGSGTVNVGVANQFAYYPASSAAVSANSTFTTTNVAISSGGSPRVNWARVTATSAGVCTVNAQNGSWISSTTPNAAGDCTLNHSGIWSVAPQCTSTVQPADATLSDAYVSNIHSTSTTIVRFTAAVSTGAAFGGATNPVSIVCIGTQ